MGAERSSTAEVTALIERRHKFEENLPVRRDDDSAEHFPSSA
jgi:hypothetical protein